ncbi:MAG: superoxide dismutase [Ni], partial [Candidatus Latescibacterota bacterium]
MGWRPFTVIALVLTYAFAPQAGAHCQIPCGIFDDETRFSAMKEHVTTIEKSMKQITELSAATPPNYNQIVRWVNNKDQHADELSEIVTYYFMAQRVKAPADSADQAATAQYVRWLTLLHGILVHAMKAKQTVEPDHCVQMNRLIDE